MFPQKSVSGNGFIFPSGPLRESLNNIKNAEIVIINGGRSEMFEKKFLKLIEILIYFILTIDH